MLDIINKQINVILNCSSCKFMASRFAYSFLRLATEISNGLDANGEASRTLIVHEMLLFKELNGLYILRFILW